MANDTPRSLKFLHRFVKNLTPHKGSWPDSMWERESYWAFSPLPEVDEESEEPMKNDPKKAKQYFENKLAFTLGPAELKAMLDEDQDFILVDVRAPRDFIEGHIPGAIHLPQSEWSTLEGLSKDRVNIVYCYSTVCHLAAKAATFFAAHGFRVMELEGGMEAWRDYNYTVETVRKSA